MNVSRKNFNVRAFVEKAEYKTCSTTSGIMLTVVLILHFDDGEQRIWDNMLIEHDNPVACRIGREKATALSVAAGFEKRPEDPSLFIGSEIKAKGVIDEDGNIRIYGYSKF